MGDSWDSKFIKLGNENLYREVIVGKIKSSINRPLYNAILNHQSSKQKGRKDLTLTTPPKVTFGR